MKRKTIKPIIISALMAVSFGATAVGTTFALFTDRADTKIEVTAGVVDLKVEYSDIKAYSLDEENNAGPLVEVTGGKFATEGTYAIDKTTGIVTLDRMVPGDRVEFDITLKNFSNVKTKYRFAMSKTGTLAPYLEASFGAATLQWKTQAASSDTVAGEVIEVAHVVIEFPNTENAITVREEGYDNSAQGKKATYKLGYEMVQGNAQVADTAPAVAPATVTQKPTQIEDDPTVYTFDIMSPDALVGVAGIAADEHDVTLKVTSADEGNFTIAGATTASYDIKVENRAENQPVTVKLYVGEGYKTVYVFHENATTPLAGTSYDPFTGYVTFTTAEFSAFHLAAVKEEITFVKNETELKNALSDEKKYIAFANDITANDAITLDYDVILDGACFKLKTTNYRNDNARSINAGWDESGSKITIRNLTVEGPTNGYSRGINIANAEIDLTVENCNVGCSYYAINMVGDGSYCDVKIKNSTLNAWGALNIWGVHNTIDVDNSTLIGNNDKTYNEDGWNDFGTIALEADTTGESDEYATDNVITIKNSLVVTDTVDNNQYHVVFNELEANNKVYFVNCEFEERIEGEAKYEELTFEAVGKNKIYLDGVEMKHAGPIVASGDPMSEEEGEF